MNPSNDPVLGIGSTTYDAVGNADGVGSFRGNILGLSQPKIG